ncbi:MAG: hypothetical protein L6R41_001457 [Letrouitia leprolyta]|nr:MAG: hypothetical protein L6R41_001457 [Letrouitia leprolyta]
MRLLDTVNGELQDFSGRQVPEYAILSHCWTPHEVSYEDFPHYRNHRWSSKYDKIKDFCRFARHRGFQWVWIDTCCIDKKSSAELSEAINSMYEWYRSAKVCYAYLADVFIKLDRHGDCDEETLRADFRGSKWFTRGWTLQELLAPSHLIFLDREWKIIGSKNWNSIPNHPASLEVQVLLKDISQATGISRSDQLEDPETQCFARKMSWLSHRETSRVEDMAYCMLGLCGVNMPLLYGEGRKAFIRLQSEFIKISDDESVFAWFATESWKANGILAASPRAFANLTQIELHRPMIGKRPYSLTNKGLQYEIPKSKSDADKKNRIGDRCSLFLDCGVEDRSQPLPCQELSVLVPLIFGTFGWERDFKDYGTVYGVISLGDKKTWADIIEKGCIYETVYISAVGSSSGQDRIFSLDNASHEALPKFSALRPTLEF